jgi:hypothetical protein
MTMPITFDDFQPGAVLGENVQTFDPELSTRWRGIFGDQPEDGARGVVEGASMAVVMMMRAYLGIVTPRPPGNVHTRQRFSLTEPPRQGESIRSVVTCMSKELKRGRRYVELQVQGTGEGGRSIYGGGMTLIWAA